MGLQKIEYPTLLTDEAINLLGYPVEAVIAEKVETMISRGDANTRERDYADVLALSKIHPVEARSLRQALDTLPTARQRDWRAFLDHTGMLICPRALRKQ